MTYFSSPEQIAQFKKIVLDHILQLKDEEWKKWRNYALTNPCPRGLLATNDENGNIIHAEYIVMTQADYDKTRAEIAEQVGEGDTYLTELLGETNQHEKIGEVDAEPVYYLPGLGTYAWGPGADCCYYLDVWLSYPAFPPNLY